MTEVGQPLVEIKLHRDRKAKRPGDNVRRLHRPGHGRSKDASDGQSTQQLRGQLRLYAAAIGKWHKVPHPAFQTALFGKIIPGFTMTNKINDRQIPSLPVSEWPEPA